MKCCCCHLISACLLIFVVAPAATTALGMMSSSSSEEGGLPAVVHDADTEWGRAIERPKDAVDACLNSENMMITEEEEVDIAIIGGGLVGLAVAIGLRGFFEKVVVYERAPELRSQSQGILSIQNNGMTALETIHPDLPSLIMKKGGCEREWLIVTNINEEKDGSIQETETKTQTGQESMEKYGRRKVGMTWHNMQQVLASLLLKGDEESNKTEERKEEKRNKARIVTGHSLSHFQEFDDHVLLHFENGAVVRSKIALGCDGVFSAVRRQLHDDDDDDAPIWFGQLNWGTIVRTSDLPPNLHPPNAVHYFQWHGNDTHARYMCMMNDGGGGWTFFQFRLADPELSKRLSGNGGRGGLGLKGIKPGLIKAAQPCPLVAQVLDLLPEERIFERSIVARMPLNSWRSPKGRVALVGDSAHGMHPNIAQGANTAFESAAAVVKALTTTTKDWVQALQEYEHVRRPRATTIQQFANAMGVHQATGQELVSRQAVKDMLGWIEDGPAATKPPPQEIVDMLQDFDPLAQPGVSKLW